MSRKSTQGRLCASCGKQIKNRVKCDTCRKRDWREANPVGYAYQNLKVSARKRGIGFFLTFEWFKDFIMGTDYLSSKGRNREGLTIDRKERHLGYAEGNLAVIPNIDNIKKYHREERFKKYTFLDTKESAGTPF